MRIAFLNPWTVAAENQAFASLSIAAQRIGHELIHCANSSDVEACNPDFVLASASTQPKLNDVPHYGVIHEPRAGFFRNRKSFYNLLSYDGHLTIADTLERFIRDATFGAAFMRPIGFYYNTCQRQEFTADVRTLIRERKLRITYFGTNWDHRRQAFFEKLSYAEGAQICGPKERWSHINPAGYGGEMPFDGVSVQARYAANGMGLCMLSDFHLRDDVMSNRLFEITSVGAIALCCDTPWVRRHFGDSLYYFNQDEDDEALQQSILSLRNIIYSDPEAAIRRAAEARRIFESKFAAEVLIDNSVRYHQTLTSLRCSELQRAESRYCPRISVIIRCGSRSIEFLRRAVESVARQTYGTFEVIFVRHAELDLSPIIDGQFSRIHSFQIVECLGGTRSKCLWAGLNAVHEEYFSILDDDDWWFSNHFEQLFRPLPQETLPKFLAYSGTIAQWQKPVPIAGGGSDRRELYRFGIHSSNAWKEVTSAFASNCFVASRDLLSPRVLMDPQMDTCEDSYLILSLISQTEPRFSYAATSLFDRSLNGQSDFSQHPQRHEDELTLQLRLLGRDRPSFVPLDAWSVFSEHWGPKLGPPTGETDETRLARESDIERIVSKWKQAASGYDPKLSNLAPKSSFVEPEIGSASIQTPREPWSYGGVFALRKPDPALFEYTLIAEILVRKGAVAAGVLNPEENDFVFRQPLSANPEIQRIRYPMQAARPTGRFVIQNWESPVESLVELISLRLMAERT